MNTKVIWDESTYTIYIYIYIYRVESMGFRGHNVIVDVTKSGSSSL
jgi:hypothetical protein